MALGSNAAKNNALTATLGDGATAGSFPSPLYLALYVGDPTAGGTELTNAGGYARAAVAAADWKATGDPTPGQKANEVVINFPTSTAGWSGTANYCALLDSATIGSGTIYDFGTLTGTVAVTAAETTVRFPVGSLIVTQG